MTTKIGLINNEWDRDNLEFLLNADDACLKDWYAQADADDLAYAQELLASYAEELREQARELKIECELEAKGTREADRVIVGILDKFKK